MLSRNLKPNAKRDRGSTPKPEAASKALLLQYFKSKGMLRYRVVVSELMVGRTTNRADIVLVSDKLECFEIKTAADNLDRLDSQIAAYSQCFDEVSVVAASRHIRSVIERSPLHVGIYEIVTTEGRAHIDVVRKPSRSPLISSTGLLDLMPALVIRNLIKNAGRGTRSELMALASDVAIKKLHIAAIRFLRDRYRLSNRTFLAKTYKRDVEPSDLTYLSAWAQTSYVEPIRSHPLVTSVDDWDIYKHIGDSFGPVPVSISELFREGVNPPKALQLRSLHPHHSELVGADGY